MSWRFKRAFIPINFAHARACDVGSVHYNSTVHVCDVGSVRYNSTVHTRDVEHRARALSEI